PCVPALLESGIIQLATKPKRLLKPRRLGVTGVDSILESALCYYALSHVGCALFAIGIGEAQGNVSRNPLSRHYYNTKSHRHLIVTLIIPHRDYRRDSSRCLKAGDFSLRRVKLTADRRPATDGQRSAVNGRRSLVDSNAASPSKNCRCQI